MQYKLLEENHEIDRLQTCIKELSEHHNNLNSHFKGIYPINPISETLSKFKNEVRDKSRLIYALVKNEDIEGFCSISIKDNQGSIDYLYVKESMRNSGYGSIFMNWALDEFSSRNIEMIDVQVVTGNPAESLYKKFGFETRIHLMTRPITK